jgi:hypothetical protein
MSLMARLPSLMKPRSVCNEYASAAIMPMNAIASNDATITIKIVNGQMSSQER